MEYIHIPLHMRPPLYIVSYTCPPLSIVSYKTTRKYTRKPPRLLVSYKQAVEKWDSDSDSDETDEEDLKV